MATFTKQYNKIEAAGETLIDLSSDTVTAANMLNGTTAHDKNGASIIGSIADMTLGNATTTNPTGATNVQTIGRSTSTRYISVPVGYNSAAKKYTISAVANGSATTPATSVSPGTATGSVNSSTGVVTVTTAAATKSVTPTVSAGYVSSGTAGTITVPQTSNTYQLPTVKAAATITPTTTNQTIAAGTYLTGAQTIKGDANLVAANIASGISIFGIDGTATINPAADYVIESGSYGTHTAGAQRTFYYQKWYSGKLEVWFSDYQATANGSAYGNMYYRDVTVDLTWFINNADLPAFVDIPYVQITMRYTSNLLGVSIVNITSTTVQTFMFGAARSITPYYDMYYVGRWK